IVGHIELPHLSRLSEIEIYTVWSNKRHQLKFLRAPCKVKELRNPDGILRRYLHRVYSHAMFVVGIGLCRKIFPVGRIQGYDRIVGVERIIVSDAITDHAVRMIGNRIVEESVSDLRRWRGC